MNFFLDLIETGKIRTKEELRSLYRQFIKTYHPDSRPERERKVDFDDLKRDYNAALGILERLAAATASEAAPAFRYDPESYMSELRDLVARGLPVSERAVRKNKAYAASIDYVSKSIEHLYGKAYNFRELDSQLKFLNRRIPRIYYYALQVFWSAYDCASGYAYARTIARRHLGCIANALREMGFGSLDAFLGDVISISAQVGAKTGIVHPDGP
jgi:hypothetical protein